MRVVVAGGPGAGKTTLAAELAARLGLPIIATDDLQHLPWSDQSSVAATWMERPGPWVMEGVTTARALRKRLEEPGKPCDVVVYLRPPLRQRGGKRQMSRQIDTILADLRAPLQRRGVELVVLAGSRDKAAWAQQWTPTAPPGG